MENHQDGHDFSVIASGKGVHGAACRGGQPVSSQFRKIHYRDVDHILGLGDHRAKVQIHTITPALQILVFSQHQRLPPLDIIINNITTNKNGYSNFQVETWS